MLRFSEPETGVTVFFVDEGIDSGPIYVQRKVEIRNMSQRQLIRETKKIGMLCLLEALEKLRKGDFRTLPNDDEEMTYFGFPTRNDVKEFRKAGGRFFNAGADV